MGWTPLPEVGYGGAGDRPQSRHALAHPVLRPGDSLAETRTAPTEPVATNAAGPASSPRRYPHLGPKGPHGEEGAMAVTLGAQDVARLRQAMSGQGGAPGDAADEDPRK